MFDVLPLTLHNINNSIVAQFSFIPLPLIESKPHNYLNKYVSLR